MLFTLVTLTLPCPFRSREALLALGLAPVAVIPDPESLSGLLLPSAWPSWLVLFGSALSSLVLNLVASLWRAKALHVSKVFRIGLYL